MKTRIVLTGLLATMMVLEASAQRAENDDMYFRAKDREQNKSIDAYASVRTQKERQKEEAAIEQEDNSNPTDSYSARNVNPEYVSRSNSEQASEDESNYYSEGYTPAATSANYNNSYYNNSNWARNSFYGNRGWGNPYYGYGGYYDPWMSGPYYNNGFYDPWMSPGYGYGPSYGWRTGWSVSFMYGNYWSPYGYGYGSPYYGGFGYGGYPSYYGGGYYGGGYYESPRVVNYGKRPSRHSAVVQPTQRITRTRPGSDNVTNVSGRSRTRQAQEDYYVRPTRRTSQFDNSSVNPGNTSRTRSNDFSTPSSQPTRSRDFSQPRESRSPSYSPSPSRGGGGSGGGGGSSPRPRGRG